MLLFRRFRREKEEPPETSEAVPTEPAPAAEEPLDIAPTPVETSPKSGTSDPEVSGPARIPPPLPDRPAEPSPSAAPVLDARSKCFVCGTPLEGRTCPTCRMTWVE
jgi:hypothetical protein